MINNNLVGGFNLPLWKMMDFVSWDEEIPNTMEQKMFQTTNQVVIIPLFTVLPIGILIVPNWCRMSSIHRMLV